MKQQLKWDNDKKEPYLVTKEDDDSVSVEPLTIKEASQWTAENKY